MWQINPHRLAFELRRIRRMNLNTVIYKAILKSLGLVLGLLFLPLTALLHLAGYRHVTIFTDRIGHLALEPDCLLKEQSLGHISCRKWIILAPPGRVANEHLLTYWQPYFSIVHNKALCFLIASLSQWGLMRYDIKNYARTIGKAQRSFQIYADWSNRPPLLQLSNEDEAWGNEMLAQLGVPEGSWFVCVHAREAGFSPIDEELHGHRNSDIKNSIAAMQQITELGGWVIRIGDPTMQPLLPAPQTIDYAHHPLKSPRLDVIICARAKFILGNTSGIALVGSIFGIPCAVSNMIPTADLWYGPQDISIPKLLWSEREHRYLSIAEAMAPPISNFRYAQQYRDAGLRVIENSPDDIVDLLTEMLERLNGTFSFKVTDKKLVRQFRKLIPETSTAYFSQASVGLHFLKKHAFTTPTQS